MVPHVVRTTTVRSESGDMEVERSYVRRKDDDSL